jgi:hypothetical protein
VSEESVTEFIDRMVDEVNDEIAEENPVSIQAHKRRDATL